MSGHLCVDYGVDGSLAHWSERTHVGRSDNDMKRVDSLLERKQEQWNVKGWLGEESVFVRVTLLSSRTIHLNEVETRRNLNNQLGLSA